MTKKCPQGLSKKEKILWMKDNRASIDEDGCWIFTGTINKYGYGKISHLGRTYYIHWFAYDAFNPEDDRINDKDLQVRHICKKQNKNRACFNPDHLKLGTPKENAADKTQDTRKSSGKKAKCVDNTLPLDQYVKKQQEVNCKEEQVSEKVMTPCFTYQGGLNGGYAVVNYRKKEDGSRIKIRLHKLAYLAYHNLPLDYDFESMVLDHLCENKACCNAEHLEKVTRSENATRSRNSSVGEEKIEQIKACIRDWLTNRKRFDRDKWAKILAVKPGTVDSYTIHRRRFTDLFDEVKKELYT